MASVVLMISIYVHKDEGSSVVIISMCALALSPLFLILIAAVDSM